VDVAPLPLRVIVVVPTPIAPELLAEKVIVPRLSVEFFARALVLPKAVVDTVRVLLKSVCVLPCGNEVDESVTVDAKFELLPNAVTLEVAIEKTLVWLSVAPFVY